MRLAEILEYPLPRPGLLLGRLLGLSTATFEASRPTDTEDVLLAALCEAQDPLVFGAWLDAGAADPRSPPRTASRH